jgi:hypothetical protein
MNPIRANREYIEAALEYSGGTHLFEDIEAGILSGKMQLWSGPNCAAVTEVIEYPRKKVLHIFLAGGDMAGLLDMMDSAEAWGRTQGCTSLTLSGRRGWSRVLDPHGFKPVLIVMERDFGRIVNANN